MSMFKWLGASLTLLRRLRGKSQAVVSREAGIGKSQLSKYENGRELPKLDSLEKVLGSLGVSHLEFACTLAFLQSREKRLAGPEEERTEELAWLLFDHGSLTKPTEEIFGRVLADLLKLHGLLVQTLLFRAAGEEAPTSAGDTHR